jgi:hypothetical protein
VRVPHSRDVLDDGAGRRQVRPKRRIAIPLQGQVATERVDHLQVVTKIPERLIAVEAKQAANLAGSVIMVNVRRWSLATTSAEPALIGGHPVKVRRIDPIAAAEMEVTRRAVVLDDILAGADVVAWLAVTTAPASSTRITWKVLERLNRLTVRAPPRTWRYDTTRCYRSPLSRPLLVEGGQGAHIHATAAVAIATVPAPFSRRKCSKWLNLTAIETALGYIRID